MTSGYSPQQPINNDGKFYSCDESFKPIYFLPENSDLIEVCVPIFGFGRPQTEVDVLVGKDGCFLTVLENLKTHKAMKKNPENWDSSNNERFLELYGPLSSAEYRFDVWKGEKIQKNEN